MQRGTKEFLYSTLGAVLLIAAGCANEPPSPPAPAGTIPAPAAETDTPKADPNAPPAATDPPKTADSAEDSETGRAESPPKAAKPASSAPIAPKPPAVPELPASTVLQESGKASAPSTESVNKPTDPMTRIVDPPTVGADSAKPDGERAAPMLPEPIAPPTISAEPAEETQSFAVPGKRMESSLRIPSGISESLRIQE